jgi:hypothetical protein
MISDLSEPVISPASGVPVHVEEPSQVITFNARAAPAKARTSYLSPPPKTNVSSPDEPSVGSSP